MENPVLIKELSGFSGCKLYLFRDKEKYFVRKISGSLDYNKRLEKQMQKQIFFFNNLKTKNISTPQVFNSGLDSSGLFFFDMEYINGMTLVEYISSSKPHELKEIAKIVTDILSLSKENVYPEEICISEKISEKVKEIKSKVRGENSLLEKIDFGAKSIPNLRKTFCHGDLTFENILYEPSTKKYYLIDLLDSFVENYWMDIVKLFQDLEGKWYMLRYPHLDEKLMEIKMFFIADFLRDKFLFQEDYLKYHRTLLALNFARILPYAQGEKYYQVLNVVQNQLKKLKKIK